MIIHVKVIAGSRTKFVEKQVDGSYKIHLLAAPEKGKANEALLSLLADFFNCPKSQIKILSGEKARHKRVEIIE